MQGKQFKKQLTDKRYYRTKLDLQHTTGRDDYTALKDDIGMQEAEKDEEGGPTRTPNPDRAVKRKGHVDINMKTKQTETQTVTNSGSMRLKVWSMDCLPNKILVSRTDLNLPTTENTYPAEKHTLRKTNPTT